MKLRDVEFERFRHGKGQNLPADTINHHQAIWNTAWDAAIANYAAAIGEAIQDAANCPTCRRSREDFDKTTTCGMGGCPWGGDL